MNAYYSSSTCSPSAMHRIGAKRGASVMVAEVEAISEIVAKRASYILEAMAGNEISRHLH